MSSYIGLWQRQSIQLADADPYEDSIVYWLQAGTYFADIRIPLDQPSLPPEKTLLSLDATELLPFARLTSFAGTIDSTETWIRWNRQIDFKPNPTRVDQGKVHYEGQNLIEVGEFPFDGKMQSYLEVWVPQPLASEDCWVLELLQESNLTTQTTTHPQALLVVVGEHFIRIVDDRGYPPEFIAPEPVQLSADELKHLMRFQVDYGRRISDTVLWQIILSNDPSRVGSALHAKPEYHAHWQENILVETWKTIQGEIWEQRWQVRESPDHHILPFPTLLNPA